MGHTEHTPGKLFIDNDHVNTNSEIIIRSTEKNYAVTFLCCEGSDDEEMQSNAARIVTTWNEYDQLKAENKALKERVQKLEAALKTIYQWPGNLSDEHYTSKTGANDAALRGQMLVSMRTIAKSYLPENF